MKSPKKQPGPAASDEVKGSPSIFHRSILPQEREVFLRPEKWVWISSLAPQLPPTARHTTHQRWIRKHSHSPPWRELFLALSGDAPFSLRGKIYTVNPGTVMIFDRRESHDHVPGPHTPLTRHLWLHTSSRHILTSNIAISNPAENLFLKPFIGKQVEILTDVWDKCRQNPSELNWSFLKTQITALLFESASEWKSPANGDGEHDMLDAVCDYIHKNLASDLSLRRLAEIAGYSPFFFHRLFVREKKQTLHQYVVAARLETAKKLLGQGQTMQAVGEQIGISSSVYFSRFFRKHTTMQPSHWRTINKMSKR